MKKSLFCCFLCTLIICLLFCQTEIAVAGNTSYPEAEDISVLVKNLPGMSDPTGTKYYFYNQLSNPEKAIYQKILNTALTKPAFTISGAGNMDFYHAANRAFDACMADNPFLHAYWKRYFSIEDNGTSGCYTIVLNQMAIAKDHFIREAQGYADAIVSSVGNSGDTYTRLRKLLEVMVYEMDYDYTALPGTEISGEMEDSVLGCLVDHHAVCAGFSDTMKYLCDRLNIPCIVVGNAGHAWNYVRMEDGKWYSVDSSCITGADGFADAEIEDEYIRQELLLGRNSSAFVGNGNYHLTLERQDEIIELYLTYENADFVFPAQEEDQYEYSGTYVAGYTEVLYEPNEALTFFSSVNEDGVSCAITGVAGSTGGDLIIPENINGLPVTVIDSDAFRFRTRFRGALHLPDTVIEIRQNAFFGCSNLTGTLHFPQGLKRIESGAFFGCEGLQGDVILPDGLEYLSDRGVFGDCRNLNGKFFLPANADFNASVILGTSIKMIDVSSASEKYTAIDDVLYTKDRKTLVYCPSNRSKNLVIPSGVVTISDSACYNCNQIQKVFFPESLKYIEKYAFQNCALKGDLIIPDSVEKIGYCAFGTNFPGENRKLKLPANLRILGDFAFARCGFSGDLYIPDGLEAIVDSDGVPLSGDGLFFNGNDFDRIIVTTLNQFFIHYNSINPIVYCNEFMIITPQEAYENVLVLPSKLTAIREEAFAGIDSEIIVVPDGCLRIEARAFADCSNLKYIWIPGSVTNIAEDAFDGSTHVKLVYEWK